MTEGEIPIGPASRTARWPYLPLLAMVCVLLLAFSLRVYHIDFQSLWTDEGRSLIRATVPLSQVAAATPVEHMPTYFAISHLWLDLAGRSDFALRFTSTFASVLAIALAYRLALELGSAGSGLIAALLLATGSFQVWYAQEARMYTWMLVSSLLSTWMLWRLLTRFARRSPSLSRAGPAGAEASPAPLFPGSSAFYLTFALYVLATAATIYLHHYGFVLPLTQAVFVLLWLAWTRDLRSFWRWVAAGVCVLAVYLPAVPRLLRMLDYSGWEQQSAPAAQLPWYFLAAYTAGDPMPQPWHTWLPWLYLGLVAIGVIAWWRENRLGTVLLVCGVVVPIAAAWALALMQPQFHERYTMLVTAPLLILVGHGFSLFSPSFWRGLAPEPAGSRMAGDSSASRASPARSVSPVLLGGLAAGALALMVAANGLALNRLYFDTNLHKADYRAAAALVKDGELPGDVIIADDSMLPDTFAHYYTGTLPVQDLTLAKYGSDAQVSAALAAATQGARRAWIVEHSGGNSPITARLLRISWPATDFDHNGLHLALVGLPSLAVTDLPITGTFGANLILRSAGLAGQESGPSAAAFRAGGIAALTTRWQVLAAPGPLKFSLRLVDSDGAPWATADYVPRAGDLPPENWQPGTTVEDRRALLLPPDLAPGSYQIWLALYDPGTGEKLPIDGQPGVTLARINVLPAARAPDPRTLAIPNRMRVPLNSELEVLGYGVEPAPVPAATGGTLWVWWRALEQPSRPYQVRVEVNGGGPPIASLTAPLSLAQPAALVPGEVVRTRYPLAFAADATSGSYKLSLSLAGADGRQTGPRVEVGKIPVQARARSYRLPHIEHPLDVKLGPSISLKGYALERPARGQQAKLALYWQAGQRVTGKYKVFMHVLDGAGKIVAQGDSFPQEGAAPTDGWLAGEVISDSHLLSVPPGGPYRILAGLYDPVSGLRLVAVDAKGNAFQDAAVPLGELTVPK